MAIAPHNVSTAAGPPETSTRHELRRTLEQTGILAADLLELLELLDTDPGDLVADTRALRRYASDAATQAAYARALRPNLADRA